MLKRPLLSIPTSALTTAIAVASFSLSAQVAANETLTLYTSQPNSDAQQTVDAFEAAYPDIEVEWVRDGTTRLMTRLRSELSAGVSNPDVLLIADSMTMESLKQEGHLQPYLSDERQAYDADLYDPEGYYYGTKLITTGIVYNTGAEHQPQSWQDLLGPDYEGLVTMPSPLYSGAALIHMAAITANLTLAWRITKRFMKTAPKPRAAMAAYLTPWPRAPSPTASWWISCQFVKQPKARRSNSCSRKRA